MIRITLLALFLAGCANDPPPRAAMQAPAVVIRPGVTVSLVWSNYGSWGDQMGVMASTNLVDWYCLTNMPYAQGEITVTLSNRPAQFEFYRSYNN